MRVADDAFGVMLTLLLAACSDALPGGAAEPTSLRTEDSAETVTAAREDTLSTTDGVSTDTTEVRCDFVYYDDECMRVTLRFWDPTLECWSTLDDRRPTEYWYDWSQWECGNTWGNRRMTNYWFSDHQICVRFAALIDVCEVDDPHIHPCNEAPFDCCSVPNTGVLPACE